MQRAVWTALVFALAALGCSGSERPTATATVAATASALRAAPQPAAAGLRATELTPRPAADRTHQRARAFVALQRRLAKFSAAEDLTGPAYDLRIPAGARPLLKALKRAGRDVIEARLSQLIEAHARGEKLPEELATAALEPFERAGAVMGDHEDRPPMGSLDVVSLRKLPGSDQLFAATLGLGLPCGYDEALFVFRYDGATGLEHMLTASSDDYASIADGQLALEYAVSPRDEHGDFFVVTAHATPWCSSLWRQLTYRAYAPGTDPERLSVLVSGESSVWLGEGLGKLEASNDRFDLQFLAWDRVGAQVTVEHRLAFERRGQKFVMAAPRFREPERVPNAWVSLEWPRAAALVAPESRRKLRAVHARWQRGVKTERGEVSVQTAGSSKAVVRFACVECEKLPKHAEFVLEQSAGAWRIRDVK